MKITFFYPGAFFSETQDIEVNSIDDMIIPNGVFCLKTEKNGLFYFGKRYTLQEVLNESKTEKDRYGVLISNMENNGYEEVVKCVTGNFRPLNKSDKVFKDKDEFIRFLKLQKINEKSNSFI